MINLLPPDYKQEYAFARRNLHARRWLYASCLVLLGLGLLTGGGWYYLDRSSQTYSAQIAATNAILNKQGQAQIQKQVQTISSNLKLVVQVLSREVLFSELLTRLGSVTPANVSLTDLSISQTKGAIDITAVATDYNAATQLQVNLADKSNQIFSKADIVSISCSSTSENSDYPCTVTIRALFGTDNPFLFINGGAKK